MRLLAIDTALEACSAALFDSRTGTCVAQQTRVMQRGHAEALVPMIGEVVEASPTGFSGIDRIAVTIGPGSFTGIRVGLSAARGLALALGKPAVGVSTLAALAAPLIDGDLVHPVAAVVDARHGRLYFQMFGPAGQTMVSPRCVPVREAARGAGVGRVLAVGSGAQMLAEAGAQMGCDIRVAEASHVPDIGWVASIGAVAEAGAAPPRPLYIHPPDAQPQQAARIARM